MFRKCLSRSWLAFALVVLGTTAARAHFLTAANAQANCSTGYNLTVDAIALTAGTRYTILYNFFVSTMSAPIKGRIDFTATGSTAVESASGSWDFTADSTSVFGALRR
jgi:hypothetical protein